MGHSSSHSNRGITLLEFLIIASMLAVMVVFLSPALGKQKGKAELDQAVKRINKTVLQAQQTARAMHSDVFLQINSGERTEVDSITISVSNKQQAESQEQIDEVIEFSEGVKLLSDRSTIRIDYRGEVDEATQLTVVSNETDDLNKRLLIY